MLDIISSVWLNRCSPPEAGADVPMMVIAMPEYSRALNKASIAAGLRLRMSPGRSK